MQTAEHRRLDQHRKRQADWRCWGPYLSERAWGTVREDYSAGGDAWGYFPHEHARSRAYRWNEDGLAGVSDRFQSICMSVALWNERDPILKERLFGLSGPEGNHGEDVKELYYYLDSTPTHSYMKMLYKYPQDAFPYERLVREGSARGVHEPELELEDMLEAPLLAGRYFDVFVEYAKAAPQDLLCRITVINRGPAAVIHVLPQVWFRNTWSWEPGAPKPHMQRAGEGQEVELQHPKAGARWWYTDGDARLMFTENETNQAKLFGASEQSPFVKDSFHEAIVNGRAERVRSGNGTKGAAHYRARLLPAQQLVIHTRLSQERLTSPFEPAPRVFAARIQEADAFYDSIQRSTQTDDERSVQRQAFAGLLWSKQFYHYSVDRWLDGDPEQPEPPASRQSGRNRDWRHLHNNDILSMPDKWEYPWYAAWDLAFHVVPIALVDPAFAKRQMILLLREWYMHPNGAIPAYEWSFSDVNPPVHAWGAWQVYKISREVTGHADLVFLERIFHKLLLNFTWWVNRKDRGGNNAFEGGFLGLDNIGVFDRSGELPTGGHLEQADGTAWMAMYCLNMLGIALELALHKPAYEDIATKFFEHFVYITNAFYDQDRVGLWHEEDGFFYDLLRAPEGRIFPMRIRSFVGLIPLLAVGGLHPKLLDHLPHFRRRVEWFLEHRPQLMRHVGSLDSLGAAGHYQVAVVDKEKLSRVLTRVFDETEFLSEYGLRSLSKGHEEAPFEFWGGGQHYRVGYEPAESQSGLFGGNSNWRGPIWFPINYLMIQALRKYHLNYGSSLKVELPTGSGRWVTLQEAADELTARLCKIFLKDSKGERAVFGGRRCFAAPEFVDHVLFYEYFHGDSGAGLGASHQTGWTALVARLLQGPDELGMSG